MAKKSKIQPSNAEEIEKAATTKKVKRGPGRGFRGKAGATTGLTVVQVWNKIMKENYKKKLTDSELVTFMNEEFPGAKKGTGYETSDIRMVRGLFNRGHLKGQEATPEKKLPEFDVEGMALPMWGEKGAARKAKGAKKEDVPATAGFKKAKKTKPAADEESDDEDDEAPAPRAKVKVRKN